MARILIHDMVVVVMVFFLLVGVGIGVGGYCSCGWWIGSIVTIVVGAMEVAIAQLLAA